MRNLLIRPLEPKTNGTEIALLLTKLLNVKISETIINKKIEEHPNFPSLLSTSDVLKKYGVDCNNQFL